MRFALSKLETIRWRPCVTLVCLIAFLVVGVAHAGSHLDLTAGKPCAEVVLSASGGDADDNVQAAAEVCLVCVLAAVEIDSSPVIVGEMAPDVQSPPLPALHVVSRPAESPPPIA
ncbi:hypothetical protein [Afipia sp. P52-10]|uniref:hypothetical protein n=1 Tax=Afipia sp. P52-10 TaxID=1429916 RepID=UPI0004ACE7EE|nr:hypothetical protein [Afipia sp. P52-10]